MASLTRATALAALAAVLAAAPVAFAQSQADLDACNQQAAAQVATGSVGASGSVTSSSPGTSVGGSVMTAPGSTDVNRVPNASGRISGSAGSPGSGTGTGTVAGGGTPMTSPSPSTSMPSASPPSGGPSASTSVSGSGASASASSSSGMATAGQNDPVYQQAFRDCLKARGF